MQPYASSTLTKASISFQVFSSNDPTSKMESRRLCVLDLSIEPAFLFMSFVFFRLTTVALLANVVSSSEETGSFDLSGLASAKAACKASASGPEPSNTVFA